MGFFLRPFVFSITLVLIAWLIELKMLRSKEFNKTKIIGIITLVSVSVLSFIYFYTDTIFDASIVFVFLVISLFLLTLTIPILNSKMKFQHTAFFIIHWCVAVLLTGTREHLLISYPSYLYGSYFLFSMTYYLYRSRERVKIIIIIGVLISLRFVYAYELDFSSNTMITRSPDTWSQYQFVARNKPTRMALDYFYENYEYSRVLSLDIIDLNPKKNGILYIIRYDYKLFKHTARIRYFEGEIQEE